MKLVALALVLALAPRALAQPPIPPAPPDPAPAPASVVVVDDNPVPLYSYCKVSVRPAAGQTVSYDVFPDPVKIEDRGDGTLYFAGLPGAKYRVVASVYSVEGTPPRVAIKKHSVLVSFAGTPPPPAPPAPPAPPVPPAPDDPLAARLAAAYRAAAGTAAEKSEWAKDLAALYRAAAKLATDASVASAGTLKNKLAAASATLIGPEALKEVRQLVAGELAAALGTDDAALSTEQRAAAAKLFQHLAAAMEALAK